MNVSGRGVGQMRGWQRLLATIGAITHSAAAS